MSRFFTDKNLGAATERAVSSEDSPSRRQRSLLRRLHIHTSIKRAKSPTPLRPPTAPAAVSGGTFVTAVRESPSQSDGSSIEEITRTMSQSLLVSTPSGSSAKRQRSADGRDLHSRPASAGQNVSSHASLKSEKPLLKPNFRMPPYLEKSRSGM